MARNFKAMGCHGTQLPSHGSDFSAMGSLDSNFWQWLTICRPWHSFFWAMGCHGLNFWAMAHIL